MSRDIPQIPGDLGDHPALLCPTGASRGKKLPPVLPAHGTNGGPSLVRKIDLLMQTGAVPSKLMGGNGEMRSANREARI